MSGIEAVLQENRKTSQPSGNQSTKTRKAVKQSRAQGSHLKKVNQNSRDHGHGHLPRKASVFY